MMKIAKTWKFRLPPLNYLGICVHAYVLLSSLLVAHDSSPAKMRLDIRLMRWHQIDQALIAFAFPTGISHVLNHRQK